MNSHLHLHETKGRTLREIGSLLVESGLALLKLQNAEIHVFETAEGDKAIPTHVEYFA